MIGDRDHLASIERELLAQRYRPEVAAAIARERITRIRLAFVAARHLEVTADVTEAFAARRTELSVAFQGRQETWLAAHERERKLESRHSVAGWWTPEGKAIWREVQSAAADREAAWSAYEPASDALDALDLRIEAEITRRWQAETPEAWGWEE